MIDRIRWYPGWISRMDIQDDIIQQYGRQNTDIRFVRCRSDDSSDDSLTIQGETGSPSMILIFPSCFWYFKIFLIFWQLSIKIMKDQFKVDYSGWVSRDEVKCIFTHFTVIITFMEILMKFVIKIFGSDSFRWF